MFDCLIYGGEPAGLWLANQIVRFESKLSPTRKKPYTPLKTAILKPKGDAIVPIPLRIANRFGISLSDWFAVEIVTPQRSFRWDENGMSTQFPEVAPLISVKPFKEKPDSTESSTLRYVIRHRPEILGFAEGLWQVFGKSERLSPELLVWNAIQLNRYGFWRATLSNPERHSLIELDSETFDQTKITSDKTAVRVETPTGEVFRAKKLILNLPLEKMPTGEQFSNIASSPVRISIEKGELPTSLKPMSLFMSTEEIPTNEEFFVVRRLENNRGFEILVNHHRDLSSTELHSRLQNGTHVVESLFPSVRLLPHKVDAQLGKERFKVVAMPISSHSENPRIRRLSPSLKCHLAHPFGVLDEAENLVREILTSKIYKEANSSVSAAEQHS